MKDRATALSIWCYAFSITCLEKQNKTNSPLGEKEEEQWAAILSWIYPASDNDLGAFYLSVYGSTQDMQCYYPYFTNQDKAWEERN